MSYHLGEASSRLRVAQPRWLLNPPKAQPGSAPSLCALLPFALACFKDVSQIWCRDSSRVSAAEKRYRQHATTIHITTYARERTLNTNLFSQTIWAPLGYPGKNPGTSRQKVWFRWVSRDIPNFLAPIPSRGRTPTPPQDQKFGFMLFSCLIHWRSMCFLKKERIHRMRGFEHSLDIEKLTIRTNFRKSWGCNCKELWACNLHSLRTAQVLKSLP